MRIAEILFSIIATTTLALELRAQPGTNRVTITPAWLSELDDELRTNHIGLQALSARTEAARQNAAAVKTWEDPAGRLGAMAGRETKRRDDGDLLYGIEEKLPLWGKPRLTRAVAQEELRLAELNQDYQFQLLRREFVKAALEAAVAGRVVDLGRQDLSLIGTLTQSAEFRYGNGTGSQVDVLRLQNESARRAAQLQNDEQRRDHSHFALNRLLGRPIADLWPNLDLPPIADEIPYNSRLVKLALHFEPRLKVLRQEIRKGEASVALTRKQKYPDVMAGIEARNFSDDSSFRQALLVFSFSLPWFNSTKYSREIKREEAKTTAATLDVKDYEQAVIEEVHHMTVAIASARREALAYRDEIIPRSEQALDSARNAWMTNKGMFNDVMDARRMLLEAQLMYARAVAEQYSMMAELTLCCGLGNLPSLEMLGVSLKPEEHQHSLEN
ncbi:MAG: czcC [Verrucomicrobiales bacterium]|nr:czcC [Verrucomicrobiales bacterium]